MNTASIVFIIAVWSGSMLFMAWAIINLRAKLDKTESALWGERRRRQRTEEQSLRLVDKVTPLIEQTDWMTGRWTGQFQTLVQKEMDRNFAVVEARRALWEIPLVAEHIQNHIGESTK